MLTVLKKYEYKLLTSVSTNFNKPKNNSLKFTLTILHIKENIKKENFLILLTIYRLKVSRKTVKSACTDINLKSKSKKSTHTEFLL